MEDVKQAILESSKGQSSHDERYGYGALDVECPDADTSPRHDPSRGPTMNRCEGDVMSGLDALDRADHAWKDAIRAAPVSSSGSTSSNGTSGSVVRSNPVGASTSDKLTHGVIVDQPTSMMMQSAGIANFGSMVAGFARADASSAFAGTPDVRTAR